MSDWRKSVRYRLASWLIGQGQQFLRDAEKREITERVKARLRKEPQGPNYMRRAQDIAAEEMTKFYTEKQQHLENAE